LSRVIGMDQNESSFKILIASLQNILVSIYAIYRYFQISNFIQFYFDLIVSTNIMYYFTNKCVIGNLT